MSKVSCEVLWCPFKVLERIGNVAYRIQFPSSSKIHHVFHVSQLKPVLGANHSVNPLPSVLNDLDEFVVVPEDLLEARYSAEGILEGLVKWWCGLLDHENSFGWM